jgi:putative hydrolase of the HAD superfamily
MIKLNNIIFDLGGVLLDIDFNKVQQAFHRIGFTNFDQQYSQLQASHLFQKLEMGKISENDFYHTLKKGSTRQIHNEQIKNAWNSILQDFRMESMNFLQMLKKGYRIFLLSNTNSIHQTAFNQILLEQAGKPSLDGYFIKSYYSHLINKRKPYVATYEWVIQDANILAAETLFIDDSINNIIGAKEAGLQTHCLLPQETIQQLGL